MPRRRLRSRRRHRHDRLGPSTPPLGLAALLVAKTVPLLDRPVLEPRRPRAKSASGLVTTLARRRADRRRNFSCQGVAPSTSSPRTAVVIPSSSAGRPLPPTQAYDPRFAGRSPLRSFQMVTRPAVGFSSSRAVLSGDRAFHTESIAGRLGAPSRISSSLARSSLSLVLLAST